MPKIIVPKASIQMDFELETGLIKPPKLKLKIQPIFGKDSVAAFSDREDESSMVACEAGAVLALKHVVGWDLEDEKGIIPCNAKSKEKYLEPLLWEIIAKTKDEKVKEEAENEETGSGKKPRELFLVALLGEMRNTANFTKN